MFHSSMIKKHILQKPYRFQKTILRPINDLKNRLKIKCGYRKKFIGDFHINHTSKYIYVRNLKVASRTILKEVGTPHTTRGGLVYADGLHVVMPSLLGWGLHTYIFKKGKCTHEIRDWLTAKEIEEYFMFSFVRNPFERIVSGFVNKITDPDFQLPSPQGFTSWEEVLGEKPENTPAGFNLFVKNYLLKHKKINGHFTPQSHSIEVDLKEPLNFIGYLENFDADWNSIASRCNFPLQTEKRNPSNKKPYQSYYRNREIIDLVYNYYKQDIDRYGYQEVYRELCDNLEKPTH